MKKIIIFSWVIFFGQITFSQTPNKFPLSGADETTPSKSEYFSWISNTNEGSTEVQTLVFLDFFRWLHDTYGLQLDIYAFDAGNIDGAGFYGSMKSERFRHNFPNSFASVSKVAAAMGTKLGMWGGPDGFGNSPEAAEARTEDIVSLFRDYNFGLLKLDGVCGGLRPEKYGDFEAMMSKVRGYVLDMVLLNHRLELGPGVKYATTFLFGGEETYIDVHMANSMTAPHHRAQALARGLTPDLTRMTEDHGVCLSSCLDFWDDDLVLQAFNRNLILAPQIYGNPWLLRDDEFPYLAYIFNLHRHYNDILVNGTVLPETKYGEKAVSRGDGATRLITLRNLSWEKKKITVSLDSEIGLTKKGKVKALLCHPYIEKLGTHSYGSKVTVEVEPFRAVLLRVTTAKETDSEVLADAPRRIKPATDCLTKLAGLKECSVPQDASSIYYATCYAADNNALEVRSLQRSGATKIPQVQKARDAFFNQKSFVGREVWDRYLFDGDMNTRFSIDFRLNGKSTFYFDLGAVTKMDKLSFFFPDIYSLYPTVGFGYATNAYISDDLTTWREIQLKPGVRYEELSADLSAERAFRYLRMYQAPLRIAEITGYSGGKEIDRSAWRASNLLPDFRQVTKAWKAEISLDNIPEGSYFCVALDGKHGEEGAYVGFKIDGQYVGAPDRAPSYPANAWEYLVRKTDSNYAYYLPLTPDMAGKTIEVYTLGFHPEIDIAPSIWLATYPVKFDKQ
jgi:hypothetical protein